MTDELVAYLLDDLSPERRAEVEARLETDVVWRWELDRLRECMAASGDIQQCVSPSAANSEEASHVDLEPPLDLVKKTCCFVEDSASGKFKLEKKRCKKKGATFSDAPACSASGRSWSLADATIGVGVLLILGALILPAIQESQAAARRGTCAFNLKALGMASANYAELNDFQLPGVSSGQPAALFLTKLVNGGVLTEDAALEIATCPDSVEAEQRSRERRKLRLPTSTELETASGPELFELLALMGMSYAVPVGYFDENRQHHAPKFTARPETPLMADAPVIGPMGIRPASHGGCTQNVLSEAGCVRPYSVCVLAGEDARVRDIHLNDAGIPAAGNSPEDVFLAPPSYSPDGPLAPGPQRTYRLQLQFFVPLVR